MSSPELRGARVVIGQCSRKRWLGCGLVGRGCERVLMKVDMLLATFGLLAEQASVVLMGTIRSAPPASSQSEHFI